MDCFIWQHWLSRFPVITGWKKKFNIDIFLYTYLIYCIWRNSSTYADIQRENTEVYIHYSYKENDHLSTWESIDGWGCVWMCEGILKTIHTITVTFFPNTHYIVMILQNCVQSIAWNKYWFARSTIHYSRQ